MIFFSVSLFLYREGRLSKQQIGAFLGGHNEFNQSVLSEFVSLHEFTHLILVQALRQFLWSFRYAYTYVKFILFVGNNWIFFSDYLEKLCKLIVLWMLLPNTIVTKIQIYLMKKIPVIFYPLLSLCLIPLYTIQMSKQKLHVSFFWKLGMTKHIYILSSPVFERNSHVIFVLTFGLCKEVLSIMTAKDKI